MKSDNTFMGVKPGKIVENDEVFVIGRGRFNLFDIHYIGKINEVFLFLARDCLGCSVYDGYFCVSGNLQPRQRVHIPKLYETKYAALCNTVDGQKIR